MSTKVENKHKSVGTRLWRNTLRVTISPGQVCGSTSQIEDLTFTGGSSRSLLFRCTDYGNSDTEIAVVVMTQPDRPRQINLDHSNELFGSHMNVENYRMLLALVNANGSVIQRQMYRNSRVEMY